MNDLQRLLGSIDVYLFDQLLRGNVAPGARVLDAGCGGGRNLIYLLRAGHPVLAADRDPWAVDAVRELARELAPGRPVDARVEPIEALSFESDCADVVLCSAVLHFARDDAHFDRMLDELWRVLAPGGLLFCRLASSIGIEACIQRLDPPGTQDTPGNGRHLLPDGSERYLVDLERLLAATGRLCGTLVDPIKTTNVQGRRCMTTWVVRKRG